MLSTPTHAKYPFPEQWPAHNAPLAPGIPRAFDYYSFSVKFPIQMPHVRSNWWWTAPLPGAIFWVIWSEPPRRLTQTQGMTQNEGCELPNKHMKCLPPRQAAHSKYWKAIYLSTLFVEWRVDFKHEWIIHNNPTKHASQQLPSLEVWKRLISIWAAEWPDEVSNGSFCGISFSIYPSQATASSPQSYSWKNFAECMLKC